MFPQLFVLCLVKIIAFPKFIKYQGMLEKVSFAVKCRKWFGGDPGQLLCVSTLRKKGPGVSIAGHVFRTQIRSVQFLSLKFYSTVY